MRAFYKWGSRNNLKGWRTGRKRMWGERLPAGAAGLSAAPVRPLTSAAAGLGVEVKENGWAAGGPDVIESTAKNLPKHTRQMLIWSFRIVQEKWYWDQALTCQRGSSWRQAWQAPPGLWGRWWWETRWADAEEEQKPEHRWPPSVWRKLSRARTLRGRQSP